MKFPKICDIASKTVVSIDIDATAAEAIDKMLIHEHRDIVVVDGSAFRILTIVDVLNLQGKDLSITMKELSLTKIPTILKTQNVLDALQFLNNEKEYICAINDDGTLYGLISHTDITSNIDPDTLMDNYRLEDFLKLGRRMRWVSKDKIISELLSEMVQDDFDNAVIVEHLKPVGILTTKDVMKIIKNKQDMDVEVGKYMSFPVDTIRKDASVKEALLFIQEKHYKRVVVVEDNGNLSGIITQKELISITYSRWANLMQEYQKELSEMNTQLQQKNKKYESLASTDSLTGLYNRYKFSELYLSLYTTMVQRDAKLSLIMLDIDFFKKVNDTYGHNLGDQVLVQLSHVLLRTLRNIDVICRWGGEEFIILLPTVELKYALVIAEKLRKNIETLEIDIVGHISASFGVSEVRQGDEMEEVIERADKALYLAKESGRNCVKSESDI